MRPWLPPAVVLLPAVMPTGCVSVQKSVLDRSWSAEPVPTEEVYVFLRSERDTLPASCSRVALLHARGGGSVRAPRMIEKMREEAGRLGANAVYVQSIREPGTVERFASAVLDVEVESDSDAIALRCDPADLPRGRTAPAATEAAAEPAPTGTPPAEEAVGTEGPDRR